MTNREENPHRGREFKVGIPVWIATCIIALLLIATVPGSSLAAQVTLQWDAILDQGIVDYHLYARTASSQFDYTTPFKTVDAASNTSSGAVTCRLTGLTDDTLYYFVVRAVNTSGEESGDSNEVSYQTPAAIDNAADSHANNSQNDAGSSEGSSQSDDTNGYQPAPEVDITPPEDTGTDITPPDVPELISPANNSTGVNPEAELITSEFDDSDSGDTHAFTRWLVYRASDDLCVFDRTSDVQLTSTILPPFILDGDTRYYWTAIHYNQKGAASSETPENGYFTTAQWIADSENQNGIPDSYEILEDTDLDNNGLTDSIQGDIKCMMSIYQNRMVGVKVTTNEQERILTAQPIDPSTITTPKGSQPATPFGLVNFKIDLTDTAESAYVTIYFSDRISDGLDWLIYDPVSGYATYEEDSTISSDGKAVTLYIEDGAPGDMDGTKNGVIVTLAGYSGEIDDANSSNSGSTLVDDDAFISDWEWEPESSCFIETVF